jgi:hypothetical protein
MFILVYIDPHLPVVFKLCNESIDAVGKLHNSYTYFYFAESREGKSGQVIVMKENADLLLIFSFSSKMLQHCVQATYKYDH